MDKEQAKAGFTKYFGAKAGKFTKETTEDEAKRIYDERSRTYDQEYLAARAVYHKPLAECLHKTLKDVFLDKPNDQIKIIDAGAGTGLIGVELKKLGYTNLCALDISAEMLKEAKEKEIYIEFICASLSEQPIPQIETGQFDALICAATLFEGLVRSSAFVEMIRMVRADGLICFNIWEKELGDYQKTISELEKAGKWICSSKQTIPMYTAEELPKETLAFVYKVLRN